MLKHSLSIIVSFFFFASAVWAHDPAHVEGSGTLLTEKREVADFTGVRLEGAFSTEIACQEKKSLEISGDDNIVPLIRTEVRDGLLHVYSERSFSTRKVLKVKIGVPALDQLAVSGANDVVVSKVSGGRIQVDAGGSSTITMAGKARSLSSELSGAATLHADSLEAEEVSVNISGAGNADVYASQKLAAQILGAGSIVYGGNPREVSRQILGAGSIEPR